VSCGALENLDGFHHELVSVRESQDVFGLKFVEARFVTLDCELELPDESGNWFHAELNLDLYRGVLGKKILKEGLANLNVVLVFDFGLRKVTILDVD